MRFGFLESSLGGSLFLVAVLFDVAIDKLLDLQGVDVAVLAVTNLKRNRFKNLKKSYFGE
jgi:hypothetical protein